VYANFSLYQYFNTHDMSFPEACHYPQIPATCLIHKAGHGCHAPDGPFGMEMARLPALAEFLDLEDSTKLLSGSRVAQETRWSKMESFTIFDRAGFDCCLV
jgi:hypothetical protein